MSKLFKLAEVIELINVNDGSQIESYDIMELPPERVDKLSDSEDEDGDELMSNICLPKDVPGCLELHPHLSDHAESEKTSEESKLDVPIDKNTTPPETIVPTGYSDNKAMNSTEKNQSTKQKAQA